MPRVTDLPHDFSDPSLLTLALRHASLGARNNERLEFLGDTVLDLVVDYRMIDDDGSISGPGIRTENADAMVRLELPILEGGAVVSRTREAGYRYQAAQERTESDIDEKYDRTPQRTARRHRAAGIGDRRLFRGGRQLPGGLRRCRGPG